MAKAEGVKPRPKPTGKKAPAAKDEKSQRERFIEAARNAEADESGIAFENAFAAIIAQKKR